MLLAFVAFLLISGPLIILCLSVLHWYGKASQSQREARELSLKAVNLEGQLTQSEAKAEKMTEIAKHAIECAAEKHFPADRTLRDADPDLSAKYKRINADIAAKYVAPTVKFCECNVSIRSDVWPQTCPACRRLVGDDILESDLIE